MLGIPNLCRKPEIGIDFRQMFGRELPTLPLPEDDANVGDFSCSSSPGEPEEKMYTKHLQRPSLLFKSGRDKAKIFEGQGKLKRNATSVRQDFFISTDSDQTDEIFISIGSDPVEAVVFDAEEEEDPCDDLNNYGIPCYSACCNSYLEAESAFCRMHCLCF